MSVHAVSEITAVQPLQSNFANLSSVLYGKILSFVINCPYVKGVSRKFQAEMAHAEKQGALHWTDRPKALQAVIDAVFSNLERDSLRWGYNGAYTYSLCGIEDAKLVKKIIQASPERKEFYLLDIGAGGFQWGFSIAHFIKEQEDLRTDITVHIISIRGESSDEPEVESYKQCKVYKFGCFKIEELSLEFKKRKLCLEGRLDLIVSRWSFRHLADPVGTFAQAYNLLRPRGHLVMDGFFFLHGENEALSDSTYDPNLNMLQLLFDTRAPFLLAPAGASSLNHFILQRPNKLPCRLPMRYIDFRQIESSWDIGSNHVCCFKREALAMRTEDLNLPEQFFHVFGDHDLFSWLEGNQLFLIPTLRHKRIWQPILSPEKA